MKTIINVEFKKIAGKKVTAQLLNQNPKLSNITRNTIIILCQQIKKYFTDHKIKVGVSHKFYEKS